MSGSCGWFPLDHRQILTWVEAHRDELPRTLDELARLPVPFRKVIVGYVTPERRMGFWREHMESFLGPASAIALTPEQQALVRDAVDELPAVFGGTLEAGRQRAAALEARMRDVFSRRDAALIFGMVGPPEPPGGLPIPPDALPPPPPEVP